ncbi:MAG TPA: prephenate dehydratase domain-containing protein [Patescibacteria group bacterium]|nr:prephenate dehydratase domain-containing protein [Patescibacteria group bacterium]
MIEHLVQGHPEHSFHALAADQLGLPGQNYRTGSETHHQLYEALRTQEHGAAVVAIVNTRSGRVATSYPHLLEGDITVTGKVNLQIEHDLYAPDGATRETVRYIHTQAPAYEQCKETIAAEYPHAQWVEEADTARSAYMVSDFSSPEHAAISPASAGIDAGLVRLHKGIQDDHTNTTSFFQVGVGEHAVVPEDANITVFALHSESPDIYGQAEQILKEIGLEVALLHPDDATEASLIVEVKTNYYGKASAAATTALRGICSATRIGGYASQPA